MHEKVLEYIMYNWLYSHQDLIELLHFRFGIKPKEASKIINELVKRGYLKVIRLERKGTKYYLRIQ